MTKEKDFSELTPDELKNLKIEFAPGCFDNFEGSQEELDALINQIKEMFASGEAQALSVPFEYDDLDEEELEILEKIEAAEDRARGRTLQ